MGHGKMGHGQTGHGKTGYGKAGHGRNATTTVLLVDDHTLLREALCESLAAEDGLTVVGQAGTADEAVRLAERARPDVILMDIEMPGDDIALRLRRIGKVSPESRIIILTMHDDPRLVRGLLGLGGVRGYLLKSVSRLELVSAIRSVAAYDGRVFVSVSPESLAEPVQPGPQPAGRELSQREIDVLGLVAEGLSNAQVADRLYIAEGTVKRHLSNIFGKLKAISRIDAVNKATSAGLLPAHFRGRSATSADAASDADSIAARSAAPSFAPMDNGATEPA